MPNFISKSTIHLLLNLNYGIIRRLILIILERQSKSLFSRTIRNILSNYIPHEIIICDDRDPTWINNRVKELINEKDYTFQCYLHSNKDPELFNKVENLQNKLKSLIKADKKSIIHESQKE